MLNLTHRSLRRVVPQDSVDENALLPLVEPSLPPSQTTGCCCWRRREPERSENSNDEGEGSLDPEEVGPTTVKTEASKSQDTERDESLGKERSQRVVLSLARRVEKSVPCMMPVRVRVAQKAESRRGSSSFLYQKVR